MMIDAEDVSGLQLYKNLFTFQLFLAKINQASNSVFAMMLSFSVFLVTFMDF
jgi:hypothetical protein